ncbi:MAG: mechanosensitive ion channel family protein [Anaerovibrio sp.]|uniref:mechanosensitive ion channel family protein n=1 Tax=Anaerovibrio sp. TaxID=1872532 RepID=UPI0025E5932C|nr:mechanosensitive ion channel family protein [Anaerovibrio sp.]MCR5176559.1 mechanosensitive ion channel family protein [Anaerovibrio sp.]
MKPNDLTAFDINSFTSYLSGLDPMEILYLFAPPIIGMIIAIILGLTLNRAVRRYIEAHPVLQQVNFKTAAIRACDGLPLLFVVSMYVYFVVQLMTLPTPIENFLSYLLFTIIAFTVLRGIARTINAVVDSIIDRNENIPKTSFLRNIINIIVYAIGIIIILAECGISIAPIITAMGIGGMAVALGMQEGLANFFSGLYLIFSRQVNIDDYIRLSTGQEGKISDITWRYTTISNIGGNTIIVPNKQIAASVLTNFSMPAQDIVIKVQCGVAYDSDLDKVERVTLEVAKRIQEEVTKKILTETGSLPDGEVPSVPDPGIYFHTFGDSAIEFSVSLNCKAFSHQYLMKHEFIKAITKRYKDEGIEIPYPVVTVVQDKTASVE